MRHATLSHPLRPLLLGIAGAALGAGVLPAQTILGYDGATSDVVEFAGPPAGPCLYPNGPVIRTYATNVAFLCSTATAQGGPPSILGDVAVDRLHDTTWVTDGFILSEFSAQGEILLSHSIPPSALGPLTGLGMNSQHQELWATDGSLLIGFIKPVDCFFFAPVVHFPTLLPLNPPAVATDVAYDPRTETLWICDSQGMITNLTEEGLLGPGGQFAISAACGLSSSLTGISVDSASTASTTLYVTDGTNVAYVDGTGAPATPTFYTTASCFPAPGGNLVGLASSARGLPYGVGMDSTGLAAPSIGTDGQAVLPNLTLRATLSGTLPGAIGLLFGSFNELCPAFPVSGLPLQIGPTPLLLLGTTGADGSGVASFGTPIPPGVTLGASVHMQWLAVTSAPSFQVTPGMVMTVSHP